MGLEMRIFYSLSGGNRLVRRGYIISEEGKINEINFSSKGPDDMSTLN
jgi:hypothetical protein